MFRPWRRRRLDPRWIGAGFVAGALGVAFTSNAAVSTDFLAGKPVVGRNADGYLELFQVDAQGELHHRWQRQSNGDWSSWSSLGGSFSPGIAVVTNRLGELELFAADRTVHHLWHAHQLAPNAKDWSEWHDLAGAVEPPLAGIQNSDGRLEVFAVSATAGTAVHIAQVSSNGAWSQWTDLGGKLEPGLAVARNRDGRLELFGLAADTHEFQHCWQRQPGGEWSAWSGLGGSFYPGFSLGQNARGVLEVFAVSRTNHIIERACQSSPGNSEHWTAWEDFGASLEPGLAVGQSADGRLEVIGVTQQRAEVTHRWENFVDGSDRWSTWTSMGQQAKAPPAVGQNEDGNLEIFAPDYSDTSKLNHRRQISRASDWLDWASMDLRTFQYNSRTWQTDEGLPANAVQALAQTRDAYLWVGTTAGLGRFDGINFTVFDTNNTPELKSSSITALCAAPDGSLWIGTDGGGLVRLLHDRFSRFTTTNGLAGEHINVIYQDRQGALWVGTTTGMSCYRNGTFSNFTTRQGLSSDNVRAICEDSAGDLWLATGAGLSRLHGQRMVSFAMPNGLPNDSVRSICQDRGGRIWIGSNNGMLWYSSVWTNFYAYNTRYGLSDTFVSAICEDREGNLWVGTYSGLNRFREGKFFPELNNEGLPFDRVNALLEDREGDLWLGSREGLVRLTPKRFSTYTRRQGLTHNNVMSVLEDQAGSLWLGTWGGGLDQLKDDRVTAYAVTNAFAQGLVLALCETHDGSLWFGADFDGGLTRFKDGQFSHFTSANGLLNAPVRVLHEDRAGTLWIGTGLGLCSFQGGTNFNAQPGAGSRAIRALCEARQGTLWVGTESGLACQRAGQWTNFTTADGLSDNTILALYEDRNQTLWVGTANGGLNRFSNGRFASCGTRQGLFSDEIFEILEDDSGWLWMSCSKGVFRVRKSELNDVCDGRTASVTSIAYGKADGLESTQCSGAAKPGAWKSRDGRLWFPTSKGLAVVDPATTKINASPPPIVITDLAVDKKPVMQPKNANSAGSAPAEPIVLRPGRGELQFDYVALSLQAPETCRFRYQLEGVDPEWVDGGSRRTAHYNNIYPGTYTFRVIACNKDGVWNDQGASLTVRLRPHLWQTWWCRGLVVLLVVGSASGTARYVTHKRMRRQLELLEHRHAIEKERGRIAKDIHDDLGSSLTRIMMLGERAEEGLSRQEEVAPHLNKIVSSARKTVQALDEIVWAVNPENDTLEGLVEYLSHYADEFFENSNVSCRLEIPVRLPAIALPAEVRHDLFLVVKEAFHNILKHARASQVRVEVSTTAAALQLRIQDNGCGFDPAHLAPGRKGNGLGNMDKRIKGLGGHLVLTSQPAEGTRLELTVPCPGAPDATQI